MKAKLNEFEKETIKAVFKTVLWYAKLFKIGTHSKINH